MSEPTGLKIKVRVYVLKHDGDDYDSQWQAIYSSAEERDKVLAQALDDSAHEEQYEEENTKPWGELSISEKLDYYFDVASSGAGPIEWDYEDQILLYDLADIETV